MKKLIMFISMALIAGVVLFSCDDDGATIYDVTVQVNFPEMEGLDIPDYSGVEVRMTNNLTGIESAAETNAQGVADFAVEEGNYDISASYATDDYNFSGIESNRAVEAAVSFEVNLVATAVGGGLVFSEIYHTGSENPEGSNYSGDSFVEIYNNSDEVIYLDGLCVGQLDHITSRESRWLDNGELYERLPITWQTWMIPGSGEDYPLEPRESVVIAQTAINHKDDPAGNPLSPVDLSNAHFETFMDNDRGDIDNPNVPNMILVYNAVSPNVPDWIIDVRGAPMLIFRLPTGTDYESFVADPDNFMQRLDGVGSFEYLMVDPDWVVDAVEIARPGDVVHKGLPAELDAGYVMTEAGSGAGTSIRRVVEAIVDGNVVYQNTNNASQDWISEWIPTPFEHPTSVD